MTTIYVKDDTILPARRAFDFYPTPLVVAQDALSYLPDTFVPKRVLDPGAGDGVWGDAARAKYRDAFIAGFELRESRKPDSYDWWITGDYMKEDVGILFDCVIGNPPYRYAEQFVQRGLDSLQDGGYMVQLLRLNFLESAKRGRGLFKEYPPLLVVVRSRRISFSGDGKTNATAYGYYLWKKGYQGDTTLKWTLSE